MKKIKTINKLLSSLTLLSPLVGIGFNNQYQNTQTIITENSNSLGEYITNQTNLGRTMGDITVNVEGTIITGYVEGEGKLVVDSDITEIGDSAFKSNQNITSLDLSNATNLTRIGNHTFASCYKLTRDLVIPSSMTSIGYYAFNSTKINSLDLSQATSLTTIGFGAFIALQNLTSVSFENCVNLQSIENYLFLYSYNLKGTTIFSSSINSIGVDAFISSKIKNFVFLSDDAPPKFSNSGWLNKSVNPYAYVPQGTKSMYESAQNFNFSSENIIEWGFNSQVANIEGKFENINILNSDNGNSDTFKVTECIPDTFSNDIFNWSLIPTGSTEVIPDGLTITNGVINWNNVPEGTYTFKIQSSFNNWTKQSNQEITLTSLANPIINGKTKIELLSGSKGSEQFNISPSSFVPDQWEIKMTEGNKPDWLSIDDNGLLTWTDQCVEGIYTFKIKATNNNFGVSSESQIISLTLENESTKFNMSLILGLALGLGVPIILATTFIIWYLTKKKKTTVKI